MISRKVICCIQTLILVLVCALQVAATTLQDNRQQWTRDDSYGFPFWVAQNHIINEDEDDEAFATRHIFCFIELPNFTREKVQKIITSLAAQFPFPDELSIYAYSDRQALQRDFEDYGVGPIRETGEKSLAERQSDRTESARAAQKEKGYLYANYFRRDIEETLDFKPNAEQQHTWQFDLKKTDGVYTGDAHKDLLIAAEQGDSTQINDLLELGANINVRDRRDNTPLLNAARKGHTDVVKLLLKKGADITLQNDTGYTALLAAAADGGAGIVEILLDAGAEINSRTGKRNISEGDTALHLAALHGYLNIVKLLTIRGANWKEKNIFGETALMNAVVTGSSEVVEYLIGLGADVRVRDFENKTTLMLAGDNRRTINALLRAGVDFKATDNQGMTALMIAAKDSQQLKAQALIDSGAGPESIVACKAWITALQAEETGKYYPGCEREEGFQTLTKIYLMSGQNKKAVEVSKQALKELGDGANSRAQLGFTYLAVGDKKGAEAQYKILHQAYLKTKDEDEKENYKKWADNLLKKLQKK